MIRSRAAILTALLVSTSLPAGAWASGFGVWDAAPESGCFCHSNPVANPSPLTTVILTIDGQEPSGFDGFTPGSTHTIEVWVLGPSVGFAGFNLETDAGVLVGDETSQVRVLTECDRRKPCQKGVPGSDCGVVVAEGCPVYDRSDPACTACSTVNAHEGGECRTCSDEIVDIQATHAESGLPATKGKPLPMWSFTWTAPEDPEIEAVRFWVAGNDVSGEGTNGYDFWNFMDPNPAVVSRR